MPQLLAGSERLRSVDEAEAVELYAAHRLRLVRLAVLLYTWHEDGLVLARQEGAAPLATEADGVSGYYTDDRLVHTPAGTRCKFIGTQPPRPC